MNPFDHLTGARSLSIPSSGQLQEEAVADTSSSQTPSSSSTPIPPAFSNDDILLGAFEAAKLIGPGGKIYISPHIALPQAALSHAINQLLFNFKYKETRLLSVLQLLSREACRINAPHLPITFHDTHLLHNLFNSGYFHHAFGCMGLQLPIPPDEQLAPGNALKKYTCIVQMGTHPLFLHFGGFLKNHLGIACESKGNTLSVIFKDSAGMEVELKLVAGNCPEQLTHGIDIRHGIFNPSAPLTLTISNSNPWKTVVFELTNSSQATDWLSLIESFTKGKRTLCGVQELDAKDQFLKALPQENRGISCAQKIVREHYPSYSTNSDAFLSVALQFLISTNLPEEESSAFLSKIIPRIDRAGPISDPVLARVYQSLKQGVSVTSVKSFLEVIAIQTVMSGSEHGSADVTRSGGKTALRLNFGTSGQCVLLPYHPTETLHRLMAGYLTAGSADDWEQLFGFLSKGLGKVRLETPQAQYIASTQSYRESRHLSREMTETRAPFLCHLSLLWGCSKTDDPALDQHLVQTVVNAVSPPTEREASRRLLETLSARGFPLPKSLYKNLQELLSQSGHVNNEKIKRVTVSALIKEKEARDLADELWLEEAGDASLLDEQMIEEGLLLANALTNQKRWHQALKVLSLLSRKSTERIDDVLNAYLRTFNTLSAAKESAEKTDRILRLAIGFKSALQRHRPPNADDLHLPKEFAEPVLKLITFCAENGAPNSASDLLIHGVELSLFVENIDKVREIGKLVFREMLNADRKAPFFAAYFMRFLVEHQLWNTSEELDRLIELSQSMARHPYQESIPLLAFFLRLLDKELLDAGQKSERSLLHEILIEKIQSLYPSDERQSPEELSRTASQLISGKSPKEIEAAVILLTDPSTASRWIQDPLILVRTSLSLLEQNDIDRDTLQRILTTLYSLAPHSSYTKEQLILLVSHTVRLMASPPVDSTIPRLFIHQHMRYIRQLVHFHETTLAAELVSALAPLMDVDDWSDEICPVILNNIPPSMPLFHLLKKKMQDPSLKMADEMAVYLSRLAIDQMNKGEPTDALTLAGELADLNYPSIVSEELKRSVHSLVGLICERTKDTDIPLKLIHRFLLGPSKSDSDCQSAIARVGERCIALDHWKPLCQWMIDVREDIDKKCGAQLAERILDTSTPNSENEWKHLIALVQYYPDIRSDKLLQFLNSVPRKEQKSLSTNFTTMWLAVIRSNEHSPATMVQGWTFILESTERSLPQSLCRPLLNFTAPSDAPNACRYREIALQAVTKFFKQHKRHPDQEEATKLLDLYRSIEPERAKKYQKPITTLLLKAKRPAEALEVAVSSSKPLFLRTDMLLASARQLRLYSGQATGPALLHLITLVRTTSAHPRFSYNPQLVSALAQLPSMDAYQAACDLLVMRMDRCTRHRYKKSDVAEAKSTIGQLVKHADDLSKLLEMKKCLDHPFVEKHLRRRIEWDHYFDRLFDSALNKKFDLKTSSVILDFFLEYGQKDIKKSDRYTQVYAKAVRLNLRSLTDSNDPQTFALYHDRLVNVFIIQINRLRLLHRQEKISDADRRAVAMAKDMAGTYISELDSDGISSNKAFTCVYHKVNELLHHMLKTGNHDLAGILKPTLMSFFATHFEDLSFQADHLVGINRFFVALCKEKLNLAPSVLYELYLTLHETNLLFLSQQPLDSQSVKKVSPEVFKSFMQCIEQIELEAEEIQGLFDPLLYAIPVSQSDVFQCHLNHANSAFAVTALLLQGKGIHFYLSTYLYLMCKFPSIPNVETQNRGLIVRNTLERLYQNRDIHSFLRATSILRSSITDIPSHHLDDCTGLMDHWIRTIELDELTALPFSHAIQNTFPLDDFHPSVKQEQKTLFFDRIYEALMQAYEHHSCPAVLKSIVCWTNKGIDNRIDLDTPAGYLEKVQSLLPVLNTSEDFELLKVALFLLTKIPNDERLSDDDQKMRADLHHRLLLRSTLLESEKGHPITQYYLHYFSRRSAVFQGYSSYVQLIQKIL